MNYAHLHLLLNHFPIIGMIIGLGLLLISFWGHNDDLRRGSFIIIAAIALLAIPTFLSGFGAQMMVTGVPGISDALIERHEGAAMLSIWFMEVTGALALIGLWHSYYFSRPARWNVLATLLFSLLTLGLMARTGNTGGDIHHPELRAGQEAPMTEGTVGSLIHIFEPSPAKFGNAIIGSLGWWGSVMVLHFIGLTLIVGTVGMLDIRIMGFLKQLPVAPLHRLVPWGMAGLGVNIVTGLLAVIGLPERSIYSIAFWLKILSLMLLGLNAVVFYCTDIFGGVEHLEAGEDAPLSAKIIAGTALFLWFAVIAFGRYIQALGDTLPPPGS